LYLFTEPIVVILVNQREMAEHYPEVSVYHWKMTVAVSLWQKNLFDEIC
jgi:hypothetical protein